MTQIANPQQQWPGRLIITSSMSAGYHQGLTDLQLEQGAGWALQGWSDPPK